MDKWDYYKERDNIIAYHITENEYNTYEISDSNSLIIEIKELNTKFNITVEDSYYDELISDINYRLCSIYEEDDDWDDEW